MYQSTSIVSGTIDFTSTQTVINPVYTGVTSFISDGSNVYIRKGQVIQPYVSGAAPVITLSVATTDVSLTGPGSGYIVESGKLKQLSAGVAGANPLAIQQSQLNAIAAGATGTTVYVAGANSEVYVYPSAGGNFQYVPFAVSATDTYTDAQYIAGQKVELLSATTLVDYNETGKVLETTSNLYSNAVQVSATANGIFVASLGGLVNGVQLYSVEGSAYPVIAGGDQGRLWNQATTGGAFAPSTVNILPLSGLAYGSSLQVVAAGKQGTVLVSSDGGASWKMAYSKTEADLIAVSASGNAAVAVSATGTGIYSTDAGQSWNISQGFPSGATAVKVTPSAVLVTAGTTIYKSTNGGQSFIAETGITAAATLRSVWLDAQGYGFGVGDAGMAYRIVPATAGATNSFSYTKIAVDAVLASDKGTGIPNQNLSSVQFSDRLTGYITGANAAGATGGLVLKTVDGGAHWKPESSGSTTLTGTPILALSADGQNGTLVGADGSVQTLNDQAEQFSSRFWYDELGRLVLSQNSKQFNIVNYVPAASVAAATSTTNPGTVRGYSYTLYDPIGRITEVGELLTDQPVIPFNNPSQVQYVAVHVPFVQGGFRHQVSATVYDINAAAPAGFTPSYLRNRVAYSAYTPEPGTPAQQTHYSYDVHGNVKSLVQVVQYDGQLLAKRVDYSYDLVSGKVNNVCYQQGQADQLNHKYTYDADNRITQVQTSTDSIVWTQDAAYQYYAHGPLAQTILGELTVETDNYAYTIQGWIKQMQGAAFSYALGYNSTDYKAISTTANILATPIATGKDLYNGNIASMTSNTPAIAAGNFQQQYAYDQLNRITSSATPGVGNAYKTGYSYDANGNILALARYDGAATPSQFDNLAYTYENTAGGYKRSTNKLRWVTDAIGSTATTADIENQAADNYSYDAIGNLVKDNQEEIANIEWTVSGKVHAVTRISGSKKPNLQFEYDASGERTVKKVLKTDGSSQTTYYIRDVSGILMGVYQYSLPATGTAATPGNSPVLTEQYLYGYTRLGVLTPPGNTMSVSALGITGSRMFGAKSYEITDHLEDVRVVVSDYIQAAQAAQVNSATDYYPFGMVARSVVSSQQYRYGFNGQEHEDDIDGGGGDYDFGARIYDSRIGRFLSLDPQSGNYPSISPYCFAGNMPIAFIDDEGENPLIAFGAIGFLVGGSTELIGQVMEGLLSGKGFKAAFKSVDWADVLSASIFTSLDVMTAGLSKLGTGSAHAAINDEFDFKLYDEQGRKLGKGKKFTYGFGEKGHKKENKEVFKDGVLGMIDVGIDLLSKIGDRVTAFLDDHMSCGEQKIVDGLVQKFKDKDYTYPITEQWGGFLLIPYGSYTGVKKDNLYDKLYDKVTKPSKNIKKRIHRGNSGHANAKRKASKLHANPRAWYRAHK